MQYRDLTGGVGFAFATAEFHEVGAEEFGASADSAVFEAA